MVGEKLRENWEQREEIKAEEGERSTGCHSAGLTSMRIICNLHILREFTTSIVTTQRCRSCDQLDRQLENTWQANDTKIWPRNNSHAQQSLWKLRNNKQDSSSDFLIQILTLKKKNRWWLWWFCCPGNQKVWPQPQIVSHQWSFSIQFMIQFNFDSVRAHLSFDAVNLTSTVQWQYSQSSKPFNEAPPRVCATSGWSEATVTALQYVCTTSASKR